MNQNTYQEEQSGPFSVAVYGERTRLGAFGRYYRYDILWKVTSSSYIYVICRLGGPYDEKLWPRAWKCCPRPQKLWPRSWKCYPRPPRAAFSRPRSQFFTIRTDRKPANNVFFFFPAVNWFYRLQMGLFKQLLSLNRLPRRLLTICKKISSTNE